MTQGEHDINANDKPAARKRGLGRGLDALLGSPRLDAPAPERLRQLPIEWLTPSPFQPRKDMNAEALRELADSISAQGVVQPVVARELGDNRYEIIAGERRWRAARMAGLGEIPVLVRRAPDQACLAIALIENIQREDLNAIEEAEALRRLLEDYRMTHQQLADAVGKSRATVTNLLRLNELPAEIKELLAGGRIEMGHARALLGLEGPAQLDLARRVVERQLSVRATEALVQALRQSPPPADRREAAPDPDIRRLQEDISARLGAAVVIRHGRKGSGQIIIRYGSLDE